ncbi:MAG: Gfo/Idh/MocA family oxidoreductase [Cytophagaceae bacterium]|nr:Gfo/Idh/MocA family oxidoreductase [Gemmatimonadaceae bacterium]
MSEFSGLDRREFIKVGATLGAGLAAGACAPAIASTAGDRPRPSAAQSMMGVPFTRMAQPRIAIVGTGLRGRSVLHELLGVGNTRITALCDALPEKVALAKAQLEKAGHPSNVATFVGERGFEALVQRDDIDLVYTATPWEWHVPVCVATMNAGKHVATEVPAAYTIEDCWTLVDTSERTRRHCIMMENCNYGYNELLVLNMVRAGLFGDVLHGGAAYNHDLRAILFETRDEGLWRRHHHTLRNANLYPTHGLGPVALYMDIHRGDRFDYMVSMSTPEAGLTKWRDDHQQTEMEKNGERYVTGDLSSSLIKTARGRTIRLEHDVSSPRPYSRINSVQGTKGVFEDYPARVYVDGMQPAHQWASLDGFKAAHEHELWRTLGTQARTGGHGGMDFVMAWRLLHCMREGLAPDMDVYDAAAWSAPGPLSEASAKAGSAPMPFPDFTRGKWSEARRSF